MFLEIFERLCANKKVSPNKALADIGMSNAIYTNWKKRGSVPQGKNLKKIADYFGVTTGYLLGEEETTVAHLDPRIAELASIAELLSTTESGIARLNLLLEEARRLQEYEKKLAELEAQHSQQNQNTTETV